MLVWGGLMVERFTVDSVVALFTPPERNASPTLFVGTREQVRALTAREAFAREHRGVGFVDIADVRSSDAIGGLSRFAKALTETHADTVVFCGMLEDDAFRRLTDLSLAAGCHVMSLPHEVQGAWVQPSVVWRQGQPLFEWARPELQGWQLALKRALDLTGAALGLVVTSPLLLAAAMMVRGSSRGPVLFRQQRLGRNGRVFECLKFRSMYLDAEQRLRSDPALLAEHVAGNFKLPEDRDPRMTPVGRVLRRTSLDELPQLWNVLVGEMSLVGPRPIVPEELSQYREDEIPVFLSLKPGMTGAWQVSGRSRVGYPDRADIELNYIRTWSVAGDVGILLRTIPAVLGAHGAH
jgi:exopolysaccharide biosynthesis polyprenyl glycosylphosphotransferase